MKSTDTFVFNSSALVFVSITPLGPKKFIFWFQIYKCPYLTFINLIPSKFYPQYAIVTSTRIHILLRRPLLNTLLCVTRKKIISSGWNIIYMVSWEQLSPNQHQGPESCLRLKSNNIGFMFRYNKAITKNKIEPVISSPHDWFLFW